jgi:exodeoxyribonuclease VII large subunit
MNIAPLEASRAETEIISVSELNLRVRKILERGVAPTWVRGEISNFTRAPSGHWYFSLKDNRAQVRCAMFRGRNQFADAPPADGMAVEVFGVATLYEPKGDYQLIVEQIRRAGPGALFEAFEKLKRRLEAEGLFDAARKKPLPAFPRRIGIVTSTAAAALRDVLIILAQRSPHVQIVVYPTPVQGAGASANIVLALDAAILRNECDTLILCRGGGSIEDLWPFNDEALARAIARCPIPIVCGIGHETDFTIADFVADVRAPTPTAAAQIAAPQSAELNATLARIHAHMERAMARNLERAMQRVDLLTRRLIHPRERLARQGERLGYLAAGLRAAWQRQHAALGARLDRDAHRLRAAAPDTANLAQRLEHIAKSLQLSFRRSLERREHRVASLAHGLQSLNPTNVLARGYSIVRNANGVVVKRSRDLRIDDPLRITFGEGSADVTVRKTDDKNM